MGDMSNGSSAGRIGNAAQFGPDDPLDPSCARITRKFVVAVIDARNLDRECLVQTMIMVHPDILAMGYGSVAEWRRSEDGERPQAVLYRVRSTPSAEANASDELAAVVKEASPNPVIVVGDSEDIRDMIEAFNYGARGYVPSSVGLDAIVEATRLSLGSGVFLPITSLRALRDAFLGPAKPEAEQLGRFTGRQLAVCEALRRGKSNKTIAYELNLCESTVKVHIRTIMKKLSAANRTEAAFKLNAVCFGNQG